MRRRSFFTTFEIGQICGVNITTVQNWVKSSKLKAFHTPGGHRRVKREDLVSFMKKFGMPIPEDLAKGPPLIIIVDDEPDILDILEALMKTGEDEIKVLKAASGVEALLMIGETKPDLLILDIMMPGMNGYEVCRKLKEKSVAGNIKIVAISGDHNPAVRDRILASGADLFFTKPLELEKLRDRCIQLLGFQRESERNVQYT
jgi:excisionase family DNA binding protein